MSTPNKEHLATIHTYARVNGKRAPKVLPLPRNRPFLVVVRGMPGSGKSTYAQTLRADVVYDWDEKINEYMRAGKAWKLSIQSLRKKMLWEVYNELELGKSVVIVGVFPKWLTLDEVLAQASSLALTDVHVVTLYGNFGTSYPLSSYTLYKLRKSFEQ